MRWPTMDRKGWKEAAWWEYVVRFAFGGSVTALAALVARRWGPEIGGLFLAFPAILPASLTLVKRHDGFTKAADDARGARLGAVALVVFAICIWQLASYFAPLALGGALVAWCVTSLSLWAWRYGRGWPHQGRPKGPRTKDRHEAREHGE